MVTTRLDKPDVAVTVDTLGLPPGVRSVHIHEIANASRQHSSVTAPLELDEPQARPQEP